MGVEDHPSHSGWAIFDITNSAHVRGEPQAVEESVDRPTIHKILVDRSVIEEILDADDELPFFFLGGEVTNGEAYVSVIVGMEADPEKLTDVVVDDIVKHTKHMTQDEDLGEFTTFGIFMRKKPARDFALLLQQDDIRFVMGGGLIDEGSILGRADAVCLDASGQLHQISEIKPVKSID